MFEFDKAIRGIASAGGIMLISGVAANSVVAVPDGRAPFAQLAATKAAQAAGDVTAARAAAHAALLRFMDASRRVPSEDGADRQAQAQRYQNLRQGIDVFLQTHQR